MFKFNFAQTLDYPLDMEDDDVLMATHPELRTDDAAEQDELVDSIEKIELPPDDEEHATSQTTCKEIPLEDLIKTFSSAISFTPLLIRPSVSLSTPIFLPRRDLYDARFQIISEDAVSESESDWDTEDEDDPGLAYDEEVLIDVGDDPVESSHVTFTSQELNVEILSSEQETSSNPFAELEDPPSSAPHRKKRRRRSKTPPPPPKRTVRRSSRPRSERLSRIKDLAYIDAPSDVIPNIYEGGLKMWECSIDVVEYLSGLVNSNTEGSPSSFRGLKVLEVGCGTAVPSAFILQSILNESLDEVSSTENESSTLIHLQDYNRSVLELVTLPNMILAWYSSNAAAQYRDSLPSEPPSPIRSSTPEIREEDEEINEDQLTVSQAKEAIKKEERPSKKRIEEPGDLDITPQMLSAFHQSLSQHNIKLRFSAGSWESFNPRSQQRMSTPSRSEGAEPAPASETPAPYDLIITSETIYRTSNVPSLLSVLRSASATYDTGERPPVRSPGILSSITRQWHLPTFSSFDDPTMEMEAAWGPIEPSTSSRFRAVLVAAKTLYLGVGGSIMEFENMARASGARVETVWEMNVGVGRKILQLAWP